MLLTRYNKLLIHLILIIIISVIHNNLQAQNKFNSKSVEIDSFIENELFGDTTGYIFNNKGDTFEIDDYKFDRSQVILRSSPAKLLADVLLPETNGVINKDTLFLEIYLEEMMGGGQGIEVKIVNDTAEAKYFDFVLHDTEPMFKNTGDSSYSREISVPVKNLRIKFKNKLGGNGTQLLGYIEGETNPFYEKNGYSKDAQSITINIKAYFKCRVKTMKN